MYKILFNEGYKLQEFVKKQNRKTFYKKKHIYGN